MVEGDFVRGFIKAHDQQNNIILNEDYGAAFGQSKGCLLYTSDAADE